MIVEQTLKHPFTAGVRPKRRSEHKNPFGSFVRAVTRFLRKSGRKCLVRASGIHDAFDQHLFIFDAITPLKDTARQP